MDRNKREMLTHSGKGCIGTCSTVSTAEISQIRPLGDLPGDSGRQLGPILWSVYFYQKIKNLNTGQYESKCASQKQGLTVFTFTGNRDISSE